MIITIFISSVILNIVLSTMVYSLTKEKPKIIYKEKPVEKIVYKDKIIYKDKIVEKIVYKDKPIHQFIPKVEPKVSKEKQELLDALNELKKKKKKSKKDQENIYTIEKVLPNLK